VPIGSSEKPFQNLTRARLGNLLGTVSFQTDHTVRSRKCRAEERIVENSTASGDRKVQNLQVTT